MAWLLPHPADLSYAFPRTTLRDDAVDGSRRGHRSGGLGDSDRGIGAERRERRAAYDRPGWGPRTQRRVRACWPESIQRALAARQAGAGHRRPWRRQLRRSEHGHAELLPLRRSGGRDRRPRDTSLGSVGSRTLPDAGGDEHKRMTAPVASPTFSQNPDHLILEDSSVQLARPVDSWQLVQKRFPVGWHPSCWSRRGLVCWMRMRRKQRHTLDHPLLLVIVEPILTRFEAGNDRMPCRRRMLGCMLTWRTVTASDVPTLRAAAEMKPPTFRGCQAFHTSVAAWLRSGVDSAQALFHF